MEIAREFKRYSYILQSDRIDDDDKELFKEIASRKAVYDVPLESAYFSGFYDKMVPFIHSLMESALKSNDFLQFAVITGCLRISKESIFTSLNNLKVHSALGEGYTEYFGFMQEEVDGLLTFYGIREKRDEAKEWYDGYMLGARKSIIHGFFGSV